MPLRDEIREQPDILGNLLEKQVQAVQQIAVELGQHTDINYVLLAGRGGRQIMPACMPSTCGAHSISYPPPWPLLHFSPCMTGRLF